MSARKNQHFVPQFYLRLFAEPGGRRISVLPLSTGRIIHGASVRDQAARPWFYDRDGSVEDALSRMEGGAAPIIAEILRRDRPPPRLSAEHQGLIVFLAIQMSRTQAAAEDANERADKVAKALLRRAMEGDERLADLDLVTISLTHPTSDAMRAGFFGIPLLYDLRIKIIVNASGRPFIASDAPVALHNRWYEGTGAPALGHANAGLQIVVPLGPDRALLLYDEDVYEVGSAASSTVRLVNPAHADLINDLQWEAARSVIFVPPNVSPSPLESAFARWRGHASDRILVEETLLSRSNSTMRTRLGVGGVPSRIAFELPFIRVRAAAPPAWDGSRSPEVRHAEWAAHVTSLAQAVDTGRLDAAGFLKMTLKVPRTPRRWRRPA